MKIHTALKICLKILVVLVAYGYILYKIKTMQIDWSSIHIKVYGYVICALLLMPFNWMVEAIKWRFLMNKVTKISIFQAYRGVLAGITVGLATPNRVGEYLGRSIVLKPKYRSTGTLATIMCSLAQIAITILVGLGSFSLVFHDVNFLSSSYLKIIFVILILLVVGLVISLFFNMQWIEKWLKRTFFKSKFINELTYIKELKKSEILRVLLLSFLRYAIFTSQYLFLLYGFGANISLMNAVCSIGLTYLLILFVPHFFIAELGVRASVAVLVFQAFTTSLEPVMIAASILWLINLALTAMLGGLQIIVQK